MVATLPTLLRGSAAVPVAGSDGRRDWRLPVPFRLQHPRGPSGFGLGLSWAVIASRGLLARGVDLTRDLSRIMIRILRHPASGVPIILLSVINQVALGIVVFLIARALGADIGLGRTVDSIHAGHAVEHGTHLLRRLGRA